MTAPLGFAAWAAAGFGFGVAYFAALRRSVETRAEGRGHLVPAFLTLGRIAAAIAFLGAAARAGALPLLVVLLGFLAARSVAVRAARGVA